MESPEGKTYIGMENTVGGSVRERGWKTVVFRTTDALEAPVAAMSRKLLFVALGSIMLTMIVLIGIISRILAPIRTLTQATADRGAGVRSQTRKTWPPGSCATPSVPSAERMATSSFAMAT